MVININRVSYLWILTARRQMPVALVSSVITLQTIVVVLLVAVVAIDQLAGIAANVATSPKIVMQNVENKDKIIINNIVEVVAVVVVIVVVRIMHRLCSLRMIQKTECGNYQRHAVTYCTSKCDSGRYTYECD